MLVIPAGATEIPDPGAEQAALIAETAARLGMPDDDARRYAAALLRWAREGFPERDAGQALARNGGPAGLVRVELHPAGSPLWRVDFPK